MNHNPIFKILSYVTCLFGTAFHFYIHLELHADEDTLPWQSMPEGFARKKTRATEKSPHPWQQHEIDQLREDNNELRAMLQESLIAREELYETQKALLINLEMELSRTGVLRQSLQAAVQKWENYKNKWQDHIKEEGTAAQELKQYKEMLKDKEQEYQAKLEKLKQEIRILAEAFTASQKVINESRQEQIVKETPQILPSSSLKEEAIALGEDLDLNELDKFEANKKTSDEDKGKQEKEEIIFISKNTLPENSYQQVNDSEEIAYLNKDEEIARSFDINELTEKGLKETDAIETKDANDEPGKMVNVAYIEKERSPFYINSKKVSNKEYQCFVRAINYKRPIHWPKGHLPLDLEKLPVINVTYEDAFLYSVWLGKRLPSLGELSRAEQEGILIDLNDDVTNEWTATPEKRGTHHLFSSQNKTDVALPNCSYNPTTGFRVASDSN